MLRWNSKELTAFTDVLGIRDISFYKFSEKTIVFSTRADWLAKIVNAKLNFKEFGGRWLLYNQISSESIFENIIRVSSGNTFKIDLSDYTYTISKYQWLPEMNNRETTIEEFSEKLYKLCTLPTINGKKISLSLSGGLDSRVILSYLLKNRNNNWHTHTFGSESHPDAKIVKRIVSSFNIIHDQINLSAAELEKLIGEMQEYSSSTLINKAASGYLQFINYKSLIDVDEIIIDGGFGEIWRREFYNRLFITGRKSLTTKDSKQIMSFMKIYRADVFNDDINKIMLQGCEEQITNRINEMPDYKDIGLENFVDLFAIKTRLPNHFAYEQSCSDTIVTGYMPFIQPYLLQDLFNIKLTLKKNGKLFKRIINQNTPRLRTFPLVKGNTIQPFWVNTIQSRLLKILYKKLKLTDHSNYSAKRTVTLLKPFILDKLNSTNIIECGIYNIDKLRKLSNSLRKDEISEMEIHELDWWLAFELLRESIY